jgi:hypothetical protein
MLSTTVSLERRAGVDLSLAGVRHPPSFPSMLSITDSPERRAEADLVRRFGNRGELWLLANGLIANRSFVGREWMEVELRLVGGP